MNTHCERTPRRSAAGLASKLQKEVFLPFGSKNPRRSAAGFFKQKAILLLFVAFYTFILPPLTPLFAQGIEDSSPPDLIAPPHPTRVFHKSRRRRRASGDRSHHHR